MQRNVEILSTLAKCAAPGAGESYDDRLYREIHGKRADVIARLVRMARGETADLVDLLLTLDSELMDLEDFHYYRQGLLMWEAK